MLQDKYPSPDYLVSPYFPPGSWQTSRYVQIFFDGYDHDLHYECRIGGGWNGRVELHFEGDDWETKYGVLIDRLMNNIQNCDDLTWSEWDYGYRCQHTKTIKWDDSEEDRVLRDSFGNLVMISQGLNSSLSNESYEVKAAHVKSFCNGSKSGSIESLKLLVAYKDYPNGWSKDAIEEHGKKMYTWLTESCG